MRLPQPTASIEHGSLARSLEHKGRICGAARLHYTRHSAATVLLALDVPERTVMEVMGWSTTAWPLAISM
jgi:integrase